MYSIRRREQTLGFEADAESAINLDYGESVMLLVGGWVGLVCMEWNGLSSFLIMNILFLLDLCVYYADGKLHFLFNFELFWFFCLLTLYR